MPVRFGNHEDEPPHRRNFSRIQKLGLYAVPLGLTALGIANIAKATTADEDAWLAAQNGPAYACADALHPSQTTTYIRGESEVPCDQFAWLYEGGEQPTARSMLTSLPQYDTAAPSAVTFPSRPTFLEDVEDRLADEDEFSEKTDGEYTRGVNYSVAGVVGLGVVVYRTRRRKER